MEYDCVIFIILQYISTVILKVNYHAVLTVQETETYGTVLAYSNTYLLTYPMIFMGYSILLQYIVLLIVTSTVYL